jgi:hypothetical protein
MNRSFFVSVFKLTAFEILAGVGWALSITLMIACYFGASFFLPVEEGEELFAKGQMLCFFCWIMGLYSITLGSKFGALQVIRGSNLFYRALGVADLVRFFAISLASTIPLVICLFVSSLFLIFGHWLWGNGLADSTISVVQFAFLFYIPFFTSTLLAVGLGSLVSAGAGAVGGLALFLTGSLLPPLLSIAAGAGSGLMEILWSLCPHFYALDWSPAAIYLWTAAGWDFFLKALSYGIFWVMVTSALGGLMFSLSKAHHE